MIPVCLHDRREISAFLTQKPYINLYAIGDLDDFFWPYTTWYAFKEGSRVRQVLLVYTGSELPVLLGMDEAPLDSLKELLAAVLPFLPRRVYAHLSGDAVQVFRKDYRVQSHGLHYKMALADPSRPEGVDTSGVERLSPADLPLLEELYARAYPGNWFDPRMLATGCYYGWRHAGRIVSVAGIHVYSPRYRAAALGNITTAPDFRGQGLCTAVTARLCQALRTQVDFIGLNVRTDNAGAIRCYERLGFAKVAEYEEFMLE